MYTLNRHLKVHYQIPTKSTVKYPVHISSHLNWGSVLSKLTNIRYLSDCRLQGYNATWRGTWSPHRATIQKVTINIFTTVEMSEVITNRNQ